jgi:hypothetical protein
LNARPGFCVTSDQSPYLGRARVEDTRQGLHASIEVPRTQLESRIVIVRNWQVRAHAGERGLGELVLFDLDEHAARLQPCHGRRELVADHARDPRQRLCAATELAQDRRSSRRR